MARPSQKLRGRKFYESIGSPKVVLAPMVDHSEFAWRLLSRTFMPWTSDTVNPLLAYTPMLHARLFSEQAKYRKEAFEPERGQCMIDVKETDAQPEERHPSWYLDGNPALDRPLFTQFCANDPEYLLSAARYVAPYCDAVDLNLGCPQGIAKKGNYGAFLQEQRPLVHKLINTLHEELQVPVTAKIRVQATREDTLEYAKMVLDAGANVLAVHGRERHQKGVLTGLADWSAIRHLRDSLPPETVIFANGNILEHDDISSCLEATGADAVMSAEANLYDPSVFGPPPRQGADVAEYWRGADGRGGWRMDGVLRRYLDIIYIYILECDPPERAPLYTIDSKHEPILATPKIASAPKVMRRSPNLVFMKGHLYKLLRPLITKHTDIRTLVNEVACGDMAAYEKILYEIEVITAKALEAYEAGDVDVAEHAKPPSSEAHRRIWRPWWVCQSHVRPLQDQPDKAAAAKKKKDKPAYARGFDPLDMGLGLSPEDVPVAG